MTQDEKEAEHQRQLTLASQEAERKNKEQMNRLFTRVMLLEEEVFALKKENFALKNGNTDAVDAQNGGGI